MEPRKIMKIETNDGYYGPLQVCHSNAGYYIGRIFYHKDGFIEPGSRESEYYESKQDAEKELQEGFEWRDAGENQYLYNDETKQYM